MPTTPSILRSNRVTASTRLESPLELYLKEVFFSPDGDVKQERYGSHSPIFWVFAGKWNFYGLAGI
ncbi:hypothetical protein [Haladaptatus sp. DYF46]|uniref:hypothetical protein n=1 Tax=Haladaptatus sp. DYF46 TaxID=2886041 RepID=UPI001E44B761|nr:hypothetical protein [Haladaptatus sp. DYF46]